MKVEDLAPGEHSISISYSEDISKCGLYIDGKPLKDVESVSLFAPAGAPLRKHMTCRITYYRTTPDGSFIVRDGEAEIAVLRGEVTGQFDGKILIEQ